MEKVYQEVYKANDGKIFATEGECLMHEFKTELKPIAEKLSDFCENTNCNYCGFHKKGFCLFTNVYPYEWKDFL